MSARPGLHPKRLVRLMKIAVERCELDLKGLVVATEAASGAYSVTPIMAAMAGAKVLAYARDSRYGKAADILTATQELARLATCKIETTTEKNEALFSEADIVTNTGHLRPIDKSAIHCMKYGAVLPLMFEAWEFRPEDIDLAACAARGIHVAGTNERHPAVDVFSYLGVLAIKFLVDAGVAVYGSRIALVCDNDFCPDLERGLGAAGAKIRTDDRISGSLLEGPLDAIFVATRPGRGMLNESVARAVAAHCDFPIIAQFFGDIDRTLANAQGISVWPPDPPAAGHMGILLSDAGPEPIIRLQAGGLKVGEILSAVQKHRIVPANWLSMVQEIPSASVTL